MMSTASGASARSESNGRDGAQRAGAAPLESEAPSLPASMDATPASVGRGDQGGADVATSAHAPGETLCHSHWTATQGPNLGPLALTFRYPPWILPLIATDPGGGVVLAVNSPQTSLVRGAPVDSGYEAVVAKLSGDCVPIWTRVLGGGADGSLVTITSVQSDVDANLVLAGWFRGTLDYGDGPVAEAGATGLFISKLDASGVHLWTRSFATGENISELRVGPQGQLVLSGSARSTTDFGDGPICPVLEERERRALAAAPESSPSVCNYLALFDAQGDLLWTQERVASMGRELALFDPAGNVLQARNETQSGRPERSLVAKLAADGGVLWTVDLADAFGLTIRTAVAYKERQLCATPNGSVVHLEPYVSQADEDASELDSNLFGALFEPHRSSLSMLDPAGTPIWTRTVADFVGGRVGALATTESGDVVLAGEFSDEAQFASQRLTAVGQRDVFVTTLDETGASRWAARIGGDDGDFAADLALAADGSVWVSGWTGATRVSSDGTVYDNLLRNGIFVTRLAR